VRGRGDEWANRKLRIRWPWWYEGQFISTYRGINTEYQHWWNKMYCVYICGRSWNTEGGGKHRSRMKENWHPIPYLMHYFCLGIGCNMDAVSEGRFLL
jgi:hypothetical protein